MIEINLPVSVEEIRKLKVGDEVRISGLMVTARDEFHKYLFEQKPERFKEILNGTFIYHCGPVVRKKDGKWEIIAAGPTTSIREEPYESEIIEFYNVRGVIGKGGMGARTLKALARSGSVYLHAIGGLAALLGKCVVNVKDVYMLEQFGAPEAMWHIEVKDFPVIVTMDSHGNSLHEKVLHESRRIARRLLGIE